MDSQTPLTIRVIVPAFQYFLKNSHACEHSLPWAIQFTFFLLQNDSENVVTAMWQIFLIQAEWFPTPPPTASKILLSTFHTNYSDIFPSPQRIHSEVWSSQSRVDCTSFFSFPHYWTEILLFSHQRSVQGTLAYIAVVRNFFIQFFKWREIMRLCENTIMTQMKHRWTLNVYRLNNIIEFPTTCRNL